jgi:hypothetical protein
MTPAPYLTDEEIAHITRPLKQGAARIRYIRRVYRVPCEPDPDGNPVVRRVDWDRRPEAAGAANDQAPAGEDWSKLREKVRYGRGPTQKRRQSAGA